jgi:DNA invertase Pin-like site-specific DNA recombinase
MAIGIYARISDDREGSGLGVKRQTDDCAALAERRGWVIGGTFVDNDMSAYRGQKRPGYERLVEALKAGEITGIVVWHTDRLTRHPRELEDLVDLLEATGATVATVQAGDIDLATASGRMVARILGAVARQESEHKGERQRRKNLEIAKAGKPTRSGTRPYGYERDGVTLCEPEAALVRELAARVAAGEALRGVVASMNTRGAVTSGGGPWTAQTARRLLLSPRIAGLRQYQGETIGDAIWPAIVDRATWETCGRILRDPARLTRRSARSYLLTGGIARCGLCGARLVARPRDDKRRCYVCAKGPGQPGCGKIKVLADDFEDLVVEMTLAALDGPALADARTRARGEAATGLDAGELTDVERRLDELAEMFADGAIARREWLAARSRLEERRDKLTAQLDATGRDRTLAMLGDDLADGWDELGFDKRRAIISAVVDTVTVGPAVRGRNRFDPDRVDIAWRA